MLCNVIGVDIINKITTVITQAVTGVVVGGLIWIKQPLAQFLAGLTLLFQIGIAVVEVVTFLLAIYLDTTSGRRESWVLLILVWILFFGKETTVNFSMDIVFCKFVLCVLVAVYANTYAPLHYDPPRGNCWEHVRNNVFALSEEIRFEDIRVLDGLVANRLIQSHKHIMEISEEREDWKPKDSTWLLINVLPWSGNSGYTKFCCMLHAKSKLPELGRNVCNKCHQWKTTNAKQIIQCNLFLTNLAGQYFSPSASLSSMLTCQLHGSF